MAKTSTTTLTLDRLRKAEKRIWSGIDRRGPDDCWEWQRGRHPQNYGLVGIGKKKHYVHRLIMSLRVGRIIPGDEHVCHHCDNPPCCNPLHLFISDAAGNLRDMDRKGRRNAPKGEGSGVAKLTRKQVLEMRRLYCTGQYPFAELGEMFGVYTMTAYNAITGRSWKHIKDYVEEARRVSQNHDRWSRFRNSKE